MFSFDWISFCMFSQIYIKYDSGQAYDETIYVAVDKAYVIGITFRQQTAPSGNSDRPRPQK